MKRKSLSEIKNELKNKYGDDIFTRKHTNNTILPNLSDDEIGKFYRLMHTYLNYGNILLLKKDIRSNPITNKDIQTYFDVKKRSVQSYMSKFRSNNVIKAIELNGKECFIVNPIYYKYYNFEYTEHLLSNFKDDIINTYGLLEYYMAKSKFENIPECLLKFLKNNSNILGVYRLYKDNEIIYIGKSVNIKSRISQHIKDKEIDSYDYCEFANESDMNIYELYYIDKFKPRLNKDCKTKQTTTIKLDEVKFSDLIRI